MRVAIPGPLILLLSLLPLIGCGDRPATQATASGSTTPSPGCVAGGSGFLRATLRGAINADLDWHEGDMSCEGSLRPDGTGLRITIAGPLAAATADGGPARRLRFLFGIDATGPDGPGRALATNVTAIVEGEQQLYATQGDDKCTTDSLHRATPDAAKPARQRIDARGFCTGPASSLDGSARVLVSRFDFAAALTAEEHP
jgi:hypothetical protein